MSVVLQVGSRVRDDVTYSSDDSSDAARELEEQRTAFGRLLAALFGLQF
jgi:hypothetical protein